MLREIIENIAKCIFRFSCIGFSKGAHLTRYFMYEHIAENYGKHRQKDLKVLSISGSKRLCLILGFDEASICDTSYPEVDVLNLPFDDASFDAVVSDQVLEHVEGSPQGAIDETLRVLKPGGLLVHATCFINPIHGAPSDYWRFSPEGLSLLMKGRARVIEAGGWGNAFIWPFIACGLKYERIPNARYHPFHWLATFNQRRLPVVTWVLAEKIG